MQSVYILERRDVWMSDDSAVLFGIFTSREKAIQELRNCKDKYWTAFCKEIEEEYSRGFETGNQWVSDKHEFGVYLREVELDEFGEC